MASFFSFPSLPFFRLILVFPSSPLHTFPSDTSIIPPSSLPSARQLFIYILLHLFSFSWMLYNSYSPQTLGVGHLLSEKKKWGYQRQTTCLLDRLGSETPRVTLFRLTRIAYIGFVALSLCVFYSDVSVGLYWAKLKCASWSRSLVNMKPHHRLHICQTYFKKHRSLASTAAKETYWL